MSTVLPLSIGFLKCIYILDTGACVSLISSGLYNRISPELRPELKPVGKTLESEVADDSLLSVEGIVSLEFKVNRDVFSWKMLVAPNRDDGLIGLDFLQFHDYVSCAKTGLRLNNQRFRTVVERVPFRAVQITCKKDVTVTANSECILQGVGNC